jgi:hypothetical protein
MPASSSSLEALAVRRTVLAEPMRKTEDEIAEYLERHQHDLPPKLRIELERRRTGSSS